MNPPSSFVSRLNTTFRHRLRIRWSDHAHAWQIEQKIGRADGMPAFVKDSDERTRVRDGYAYIMTVTVGDTRPCPHCRRDLTVPVHESGYITCLCGTAHVLGYFPLSDILIDHLKSIDPERRDVVANAKGMDIRNAESESRILQAHANQVVSGFDDDYRRLLQIPMTGYTGKFHV